MSQAATEQGEIEVLRVLTLDGGGAKGFYTLGVLKEIEAMIGCPLHHSSISFSARARAPSSRH